MKIFGTMSLLLISILTFTMSPLAFAKEKTMTIEDLKALKDQSAWVELAGHLGDISPSQRNTEWEGIAQAAALGILQSETSETDHFRALSMAEGILEHFPSVKKSKEFMNKRAEVGLGFFKKCYQDNWAAAQCFSSLKHFTALDPQNSNLHADAGRLVRLNSNHYNAIGFFNNAFEAKADKKLCSDEDLKLSVIAALGLPTSGDENATMVKAAKNIASKFCFKELSNEIKENMSNGGGYFVENACAVVKGKGILSNLQEKKCK